MIFWFHSLRQSYVWHAKPRDDTGSCDTAAASTRAYSLNCTRFSPVADRIDCLCCVDQDTRSTRQLINKLPVKDLRESSVIPWYKFGPSGVQKMLSTCRWLASLVNKQPGLDGSCGWPPRRLCQRYYRPREACATLVSAAQPFAWNCQNSGLASVSHVVHCITGYEQLAPSTGFGLPKTYSTLSNLFSCKNLPYAGNIHRVKAAGSPNVHRWSAVPDVDDRENESAQLRIKLRFHLIIVKLNLSYTRVKIEAYLRLCIFIIQRDRPWSRGPEPATETDGTDSTMIACLGNICHSGLRHLIPCTRVFLCLVAYTGNSVIRSLSLTTEDLAWNCPLRYTSHPAHPWLRRKCKKRRIRSAK